MFSGGCAIGMDCGTSCLNGSPGPAYTNWNVGACDSVWSYLTSIRCASSGGRCSGGVNCGWLELALNSVPTGTSWNIGACDFFWAVLSGHRYALYGGVGFDGAHCGMSYFAVDDPPGNIRWYVGACIVIFGGVILLISGRPSWVEDAVMIHDVVYIIWRCTRFPDM